MTLRFCLSSNYFLVFVLIYAPADSFHGSAMRENSGSVDWTGSHFPSYIQIEKKELKASIEAPFETLQHAIKSSHIRPFNQQNSQATTLQLAISPHKHLVFFVPSNLHTAIPLTSLSYNH
ncbi:hypothetical protein XENOCAPTIV_006685 [Xenoophorus captivus]|uniref:Uncharacterized protein n=1 Tax=Xenoophorus captivus TaxID=1517983 RepID=A0ABV0SGV5_9TELE